MCVVGSSSSSPHPPRPQKIDVNQNAKNGAAAPITADIIDHCEAERMLMIRGRYQKALYNIVCFSARELRLGSAKLDLRKPSPCLAGC